MNEEAELDDTWPRKGQPISYEMFSVTLKSQVHVCLANEDMLVVQDYVLQSTQVQKQNQNTSANNSEPRIIFLRKNHSLDL